MLKLSLYGFEFYLIKEQYFIFYFDYHIPHDIIFDEEDAVKIVCQWINREMDSSLLADYYGPTAQQFKEAYDRLERVSKP